MYVTVEPGITWADMTSALAERGVRTAFWGPFSGLKATVGGSMSQNSVSLGSGNYGISADTALSFDVVLASGEILSTRLGRQRQSVAVLPALRARPDRDIYRGRRRVRYQGQNHSAARARACVFGHGIVRLQ